MSKITPEELREQLVMSMFFKVENLYQEQERQRKLAAEEIENLRAALSQIESLNPPKSLFARLAREALEGKTND